MPISSTPLRIRNHGKLCPTCGLRIFALAELHLVRLLQPHHLCSGAASLYRQQQHAAGGVSPVMDACALARHEGDPAKRQAVP